MNDNNKNYNDNYTLLKIENDLVAVGLMLIVSIPVAIGLAFFIV